MAQDFFSENILESYIESLKKIRQPEERLRKSQFIIDWLDWLRSKSFITKSEYERSLSRVKKHMYPTVNKYTNVSAYVTNRYIRAVFLLVLAAVVSVVIYTYWVSKKGEDAYPRSVVKSLNSRTLPYKGTLVDDRGLPITSKKDITFRIYTSPAVGEPLYTGSCKGESAVEPDYNGNFTVVLGSDCGMSYIPEMIFQTHKEIYLGVQLGSDKELTPRQKISTSGYSSDAAKLQGLPLGSEKETIPFINKEGRVIFTHSDPYLQTITGSFTIESPDIAIKTTGSENGTILFQPAPAGNTIVGNGKFGIGTFTPVSALTVQSIEPFAGVANLKNLANEDNDSLSILQLHMGSPITGTESTFVEFYAESTEEQEGITVGSIRLNNEGVAYETSGADFAEYFETEEPNIKPGYIVSISSTGIHKSRPGENIIGVTSERAGFIGNKKSTNKKQSLVALVGQVDIYITNINGNISKGDSIGISSIPGYGAKGLQMEKEVGYALEESNQENKITCADVVREMYGQDVYCGKISVLLK